MTKLNERLLELDMHHAFEEHRETSQSGLSCIRLWILVISAPFIALGSAVTANEADFQYIESIFPYLRVFLAFGGVMGILLIFLHSTKDAARTQCKIAMNTFREMYVRKSSSERYFLNALPTDLSPLRNPITFHPDVFFSSFSALFSFFGGAVCGMYIGGAIFVSDLSNVQWIPLILFMMVAAVICTVHLRRKVGQVLQGAKEALEEQQP